MKQMNAKQITLAALAMALVCVSTMMIQIPIPLGYMHLGNCCILLFGVFFSKTIGTLAGGVGSCMADLLSGYPQWILPTLIIKGIMGYAIAAISKDKDGQVKMASWRTLASFCCRNHHYDCGVHRGRHLPVWKRGFRTGTDPGADYGRCHRNDPVLYHWLCF